jgi:hypothetical protein
MRAVFALLSSALCFCGLVPLLPLIARPLELHLTVTSCLASQGFAARTPLSCGVTSSPVLTAGLCLRSSVEATSLLLSNGPASWGRFPTKAGTWAGTRLHGGTFDEVFTLKAATSFPLGPDPAIMVAATPRSVLACGGPINILIFKPSADTSAVDTPSAGAAQHTAPPPTSNNLSPPVESVGVRPPSARCSGKLGKSARRARQRRSLAAASHSLAVASGEEMASEEWPPCRHTLLRFLQEAKAEHR